MDIMELCVFLYKVVCVQCNLANKKHYGVVYKYNKDIDVDEM